MSINTNIPLVDEETRIDVFDYFPVITNKKIYYEILTQHIDYYDAQQNQTFQDDISFLKESSLEWRVPLTVQKRLDMMDTDWNKLPSRLHEMPNIYLQDLALFLDDSTKVSRLLYRADIDSSTWHWQEKSKCFPLIETTEDHPPFSHSQHERQAYAADQTRKATYSHRCARKLALFDSLSTTGRNSDVNVDTYSNPTPPDYGREISTTITTAIASTQAVTSMNATAAGKPATSETTACGNIQNYEALYRPPGCKFLPHREIDDFIKQKKQVSCNIKQKCDA
ncbi:hypothetical protein MAM1_0200c07862 [Mucor ambiguus]|uniref:Uncharacterized protein n=1 Tax=Mucor ambiguus TaxID=91626 RepID=A0A0C9N1A9_9FUNG|nr:hypothetical protein MAM1_0200c07862 [Mucor ambiguus]